MANFKFKILTGADPQAQYNAITAKDSMTFYLLNTGIGYLGETLLFDATDDRDMVTNLLGEGYTGDNETVASTKAIVDFVTTKVGDIAGALNDAFFRKVESHTVTADDLTNGTISFPEGVQEGDVGLLFTADTNNKDDGNETYYFISLVDYLQNVYTVESTNSIEMAMSPDNKITANLKIKADEKSIKIDEVSGGVYVEKAIEINDGDGTEEGGVAPSATKLVTEQALVNYIVNSVLPAINTTIQEALTDVVTYAVDDGVNAEG